MAIIFSSPKISLQDLPVFKLELPGKTTPDTFQFFWNIRIFHIIPSVAHPMSISVSIGPVLRVKGRPANHCAIYSPMQDKQDLVNYYIPQAVFSAIIPKRFPFSVAVSTFLKSLSFY
jgi:hypothetical protein